MQLVSIETEADWRQCTYVRWISLKMAAELVRLIDLSLGAEPCGVVNFNHLHGLLHGIVNRLVNLEGLPFYEGGGTGPTPHYEGVSKANGGAEATDGEAVLADVGRDSAAAKEGGTEVSLDSDKDLSPAHRQYSGADRTISGASVGGGGSGSTKRVTSGYVQSRVSLVSAANDLGVLERKLQELESRVNTMESLPEMLERKSSDSGATPVADMWNFTNLNKRLGAAEEGLEKVTSVYDEITL